jgi:hypothetical protein
VSALEDSLQDADPGAAHRGLEGDPELDVEAARWTYFRPARPRLLDALSAVSGVDRSALSPWLRESGVGLVVSGLELDIIVENLDDAWERLVVHGVVADTPRWPESWDRFVTSAGRLAVLAADWENVLAVESLAREFARRVSAWWPTVNERGFVSWCAADDYEINEWEGARSPLDPLDRALGRLWWWNDEPPDNNTPPLFFDARATPGDRALLDGLWRSALEAGRGWRRRSLVSGLLDESIVAVQLARAVEQDRTLSLRPDGTTTEVILPARALLDPTAPLRAIRRLGYALAEVSANTDRPRELILVAPTATWPPRG